MLSYFFEDYSGNSPVYDAKHFRRTFRMPRDLFDEILERVTAHDRYFVQKRDACKVKPKNSRSLTSTKIFSHYQVPGFSPLQKVVSAVRMLTSGVYAHELDDKFRLGESTCLENLQRFCQALIALYGDEFLRSPNIMDLHRLLDENNEAGWPGCIGSIDCMHIRWKNCPSAWAGMFTGKEGTPTVVLEAVADHYGRIWHFFFGCPGSLNDLNVLDRSPLLHDVINGSKISVHYEVNGHTYVLPYWLADGIYPKHQCFVKTISRPVSRIQQVFSAQQEKKRKEVERAFGMLQARFHILTVPVKLWSRDAMCDVVKAAFVLHNLIIDYEKRNGIDSNYINDKEYEPKHPFEIIASRSEANTSEAVRCVNLARIQNADLHAQLQSDLMQHIWMLKANELL